jgi:hypothetical protein
MSDKDKAIGTPVITWQECVRDLLSIVQAETDTAKLERIAEALGGAKEAAAGRRQALRVLSGRPAYGSG